MAGVVSWATSEDSVRTHSQQDANFDSMSVTRGMGGGDRGSLSPKESSSELIDVAIFSHYAGSIISRMCDPTHIAQRANIIKSCNTDSLESLEVMNGLTPVGLTSYLTEKLEEVDRDLNGWIAECELERILGSIPCVELTSKEITDICSSLTRKWYTDLERNENDMMENESEEEFEKEEQRGLMIQWSPFIPNAYNFILNLRFHKKVERRVMLNKPEGMDNKTFNEGLQSVKEVANKFINLVKLMKTPGTADKNNPLVATFSLKFTEIQTSIRIAE